MSTELLSLQARADRHGALADPVRLRIVDLLTLGDYSPGSLQADLGISSNLLSHHLARLEAVGLISRHRSEADKRRTYVRLVPQSLDGLAPAPAFGARRVVFVCTGNSARSQLAAALWRQASDVPTASAGTHPAPAVHPGALAIAERRGLAIPDPTPRPLGDVLEADDYVITVCDSAHEELGGADALHWSVPDPVAVGGAAAFRSAFDDIAARIEILAPCVISQPKEPS